MDSKEDNMSKELKLIEEDFQNEWWKPASVDEFDMTKKLLRVGCRPLKRKYLNCLKTSNMDSSTFSACSMLRNELDDCYRILQHINTTEKRAQDKKK